VLSISSLMAGYNAQLFNKMANFASNT